MHMLHGRACCPTLTPKVWLLLNKCVPHTYFHLPSRTHSAQVAVVRAAGTPQQRVWHSALGGVLAATAGAGALSPCVVIVGRVAALPAQWRAQPDGEAPA